MWDNPLSYKEDTELLNEVKLEMENANIQENVEITKDDTTMQLRKMPNYKAPELDDIQRFGLTLEVN